jgi:GNAT superfamily N-acetyltransferase
VTTFGRENLADVWDEATPLLEAHYHEIAHFQDIPLCPDRGRYEEMERRGALRVFTLRHSNELVGYAVYLVSAALHYSTSLQAFQDVVYLKPEYRGKMAGAHLIARADQCLKQEGVQVVYQHVKVAHDFAPLLLRLGYELVDQIYARRLN